MIEKWVTGKEDVSNADFPMVVDPIHKILYCELPKVGSSNWKRVLIKLTDPRYEDVKNVLGSVSFNLDYELTETIKHFERNFIYVFIQEFII